jgi:P2 family phage contractile tail tube protein
MSNLRDASVLQDFTVWINDVGKIGTCPSFQLPEIKIQTEEFRGAGMDGTVEMPFGIDKIEFDFDFHSYDDQVWTLLGYGPGSLDVPIVFRGYLMVPSNVGIYAGGTGFAGLQAGMEKGVVIETRSLIKEIKPGKAEPGKKTSMSVSVVANYYRHEIDGNTVTEIDVFNKITNIGGSDRSARARQFLGFSY